MRGRHSDAGCNVATDTAERYSETTGDREPLWTATENGSPSRRHVGSGTNESTRGVVGVVELLEELARASVELAGETADRSSLAKRAVVDRGMQFVPVCVQAQVDIEDLVTALIKSKQSGEVPEAW
jgi:hypothetical protein